MANQIIQMNRLKYLIRLLFEQKSVRAIAKITGLSRTTVDKYVAIIKKQSLSYEALLQLKDKDLLDIIQPPTIPKLATEHRNLYSKFPKMEVDLQRVGVTKQTLWQKYKAEYADGVQYTQFCFHFNTYLKSQKLSYVFEHKAGDKVMVDYAGKKLHLVDYQTGEMVPVDFFVAILPCSGLTYGEASASQKSPDFLSSLANCLAYFQGVPQAIVTDNLKPAVNKASKYEPGLNKSFSDFLEHYNTTGLPTRSRKPRDKALVESAVNILYTRVYEPLHGQIFHSLPAINEAIRPLIVAHNNMLFQGRDYSRRQQFEESEKAALKPLPNTAFELKKYQKCRLNLNCHAYLAEDKHHYSAPYQYVNQAVELVYNNHEVEIFCNYERIAVHQRLKAAYKFTTNASHLSPSHQYYKNYGKATFEAKGLQIGPNTALFMSQVMSQAKHPEQGFHICQGVLQLAQKHGNHKIEEAAAICIYYELLTYSKLEYYLKVDKIEHEIEQKNEVVIIHENIRGASYYQ